MAWLLVFLAWYKDGVCTDNTPYGQALQLGHCFLICIQQLHLCGSTEVYRTVLHCVIPDVWSYERNGCFDLCDLFRTNPWIKYICILLISLNGKSLVDAKIPRSRQVLTLAAQSKESVTKIEPLYVVDSTVLFMRMSVLLERSGFGIGISATLNIAITSQYFIKHRGKANGIIFAGCSLGACVFPPVIEYLLEKYGLKGTFLLLSGISLNTLVSTLLMKDPPTILKRRRQTNTDKKITDFDEVSSVEIIQNKDLEANSFNKGLKQNCLVEEKSSNPPISAKELVLSTLKSGYLYAIVASGQAATVALVYFYTTIPDHALSLGIGIYETAYLLSITSIADLCGRIVIGILIDKNFIQICNSYGLSLILSGTFMLAIGLCLNASFVTLTVLCCCFGIAHGSCNIHMPIMVSHYMAAEKLPIVMCSLSLVSVIPIFGLAPVSTYFFDTYGSYSGLYFIMTAFFTLPAIGWFCFGFVNWYKTK
ncbi:Monocarboxylate transporter 12 [Nymphon striatum]|nr:Monocarboxylate transporter 12 [Nymphon striatum]